ncbi:DUF4907 domain-containing protein [Dyadobacter sp. NIV53]|uniref:DUF4907 domain-containing protein n=1 Tax=Dyadobacter sp. NIV53 TaxID=2861765 RepID=UPI001E2C6E87|nr:DUF4907 domain-containing protein [Dyadobacter sp. NIV53]
MKIRNKYKIILICLIAFAVLAFVFFRGIPNGNESQNSEGFRNLKVEAFKRETGWGYRIYADTTAIIEQLYIPGVSGKIGFQTKDLALKTGRLVIHKLEKGIFPPTITALELDSMKVNY